MFTFIAIMLITVGIISIFIAIYSLYCSIGTWNFKKKVDSNGEDALNDKNRFNLIIWIIKKSKKVQNAKGDRLKKIVSKKAAISICIAITILINSLYSAFVSISIGVVTFNMDAQVATVTSALQTIFGKDDDCKCYALCTGDKADDEYTAYELLFGPTEYDKLTKDMKSALNKEQQESFESIESKKSGKDASDFIREHITEDMVNDYKELVGSNSKFRSDDGLDRSQMSYDELKDDLFNLLCDYKVNGRNPNCDCGTCSKAMLKTKCMGMEHYKEGWSWDAIWDSDDDDSEKANNPGTATGKFAVNLDDGSYYWYHQSLETCDYNAYSDKYGYVGSCRAGGESQGTVKDRGCGIYSTAMALSNLLGEEITPWNVITDVMGCSVNTASDGTMYFIATSANGISYENAVQMDMAKLAYLINKAYGSRGIVAEVVDFSQDTIDSYLYSDDMYAYAITSYKTASGFSWYRGDGHFMVLRPGSEEGKYKCFTSAGNGHTDIVKRMNTELSWSTVKSAEKHGECVMIHRAKSYYSTGSDDNSGTGGGSAGYNKEVYDILKKSNKYKAKAKAMAMVYGMFEEKYGKNQAIGMMANVFHEGNFGVVESAFAMYHYFDFYLPSGSTTVVKSKKDAEYLKNWNADSRHQKRQKVTNSRGQTINYQEASCGAGIFAWSFYLRVYLAENYIKSCSAYSQDELAVVEIEFMEDLLDGKYANKKPYGYDYRSVIKHMKGKSANECASIFCEEFERPWNVSTAKGLRASTAGEIKAMLSNVKTHGVTSNTSGSDVSSDGNSSSGGSKGEQVAEYGKKFVGNHYKWGGTNLTVSNWKNDPGHLAHVNVSEAEKRNCPLAGADCSGFVCAVYAHFGKSLPHSSSDLASVGTKVDNPSTSNMKPGDIVCYHNHVAIYIGGGKIVHASNHAEGIKISDKWNYKTVVSVRRIFK